MSSFDHLARARSVVAQAARVAWPPLTAAPQLYALKHSSKDGFAPGSCLPEILGRAFGFAACARSRADGGRAAAIGHALGALFQLLLLDAVARARAASAATATSASIGRDRSKTRCRGGAVRSSKLTR